MLGFIECSPLGGTQNKVSTHLDEHLGTTITLRWSAVHRHGLPVTGELQSEVLPHELLDHLLEDEEKIYFTT